MTKKKRIKIQRIQWHKGVGNVTCCEIREFEVVMDSLGLSGMSIGADRVDPHVMVNREQV